MTTSVPAKAPADPTCASASGRPVLRPSPKPRQSVNVVTTTHEADERWIETLGAPSRSAPRPARLGDTESGRRHLRLQATLDEISEQLAVVERLLADSALFGERRPSDVAAPVPDPPLTPRQIEVLALVAEGRSTECIAARLWLSKATVRNHIARALRALGAHSRLEAVAKAREHGWV
jgi:DNA-binding CsgD family transcriptional regulator